MSTDGTLVCVECGAIAVGPAYGWKAYLGHDGDDVSDVECTLEVAVYCPFCAASEFESEM